MFKRINITSFFLVGAIILSLSIPAGAQISQKKPNIILIQVDQMRPDHLNQMPKLMTLAKDGVVFEHAYTAAPLCQPSRTSIITGLYPSRTKIYGNQTGPIHNDLRDETFMNHLQNAGYFTALIGKHHYIDRYAVGIDVTKEDKAEIGKYGIDYLVQCLDVGEHIPNNDNTENIDDYINYLKQKGLLEKYFNEVREGIRSGHHPLAPDDSEDGFIGLQAADFIKKYDKVEPFYLNVSFIGPHPPYMVPGEVKTKPEDTKPPKLASPSSNTSRRRAVYADMCANIDHYIGNIIETLESKKYLDNTVILFVSDHGDNLGDYGIWDKRYFYEQSVGVPLVIYGKGVPGRNIRFGSVRSKALVSTLDIYPTILSVAGVDISDLDRPGKNLIEIAKGNPSALRSAVFSELGTCAMIRTASWKMVFDPEQGGTCYLFNLINDPEEKNNLSGMPGYEAITADLTSQLLSKYITNFQTTQGKEQIRLQKVRVRSKD
ncbi:sulfatase family protein [Maribellus comscasis]|nr:sulfatase-like hydrolase/transferase [Maribellus comscasis]